MKTLLVLSALAAIATAGPALPSDDITDFEVTKNEKRSPTFSHGSAPIHHLPVVHHTYVQPVIPHHLGLKKPLLFNHHGHHHYRSDDEQVETDPAESKESKNKCMKEMEAKCSDDLVAKSSELADGTNIEDIDENITETDVAQSLMMAKEAVNTLQKKLQKAEKNSKMTHWKQVELESDVKLHENIETAKQALDHMQLNFGNLESMNVHATTFKDAAVHDVHLQLAGSEQERLAQWKDAIENIQKNVELVKNIEDSFQQNENSDMKSATFEKSSSLTKGKSEDQKSSLDSKTLKQENVSSKRTSEMQMEGKSTGLKSSWKPMDFEKSANIESSNLKNDMVSSATSLSGSKVSLDGVSENHDKSSRTENSQSQVSHLKEHHEINHNTEELLHKRDSGMASTKIGLSSTLNTDKSQIDNEGTKKSKDGEDSTKITEVMIAKPMEPASSLIKTLKSSESVNIKLTNLADEKSSHIVDTTTLMKSVDQQSQSELISHPEKQAKNSLKTDDEKEPKTHMDTGKSSELDTTKATDGKSLAISLGSSLKGAQSEMTMKSPDQTTGQSQHSEVVLKTVQPVSPVLQSEKSGPQTLVGTQEKSVEGSLLHNIGLNAGFKSSVDAPKSMSWKEAPKHGSSRGAYGSGVSLGGYGGGAGYSAGAGAGSGAVGVFPNAHVGGCAIPLLLSCSPSVVAGSIAKAHHASYAAPSYAAPSYRGSENTITHTKRDITKIGGKRRTPIKNYKQKTIFATDRL